MRLSAGCGVLLAVAGACGGASGGTPGNPDGSGGGDSAGAVDGGPSFDASPPDADPCPIDRNAMVTAILTTVADDEMRIIVNGVLVDETVRTWHEPQQYAIQLFRHPRRKNIIALEAANRISVNGLDRGVLVDLSYRIDEEEHVVTTSAAWKAHATPDPGWESLAYDDGFWANPVDLGPHGMAPWGEVFATLAPGTAARWLWTYAATGLATEKVADETIYLRGSFYLDQEGAPSAAIPVCTGVAVR